MNKPGRILLGFFIGILGGAVVGFITGYITELISIGTHGRYIVLLTPLYVPATIFAVFQGFLMLFAGVVLGLVIGPVTAAINRPRIGWLIGPLVGIVEGLIFLLLGNEGRIDLEILFDATIIGTIIGLLVTIALLRLPQISDSSTSKGLPQLLQATADASSRRKLVIRIGICLSAILVAAFFIVAGEEYLTPLMIIVIIIFGAASAYYGYLLRKKKN
jgi:hypothetical protein